MPTAPANIPESWAKLQALREVLSSAELDQSHLFKDWPESPDAYTEEQLGILSELYVFRNQYRGGVEQYVRNAKRLLLELNIVEPEFISLNIPPKLYKAPSLFDRTRELIALEREGVGLVQRSVFVLVAGGLGERLGVSGIKLGLPVETATKCCFLEHYLRWVNYLAGPNAPFVIMTSDDTHESTQRLLPRLHHGMRNVHLLKQETVFCFTDMLAHLAIEKGKLLRKPHGHGDVHALLYQATEPFSGKRLVDIWKSQGYSYIVFLQDTNATATLTIPLSLAVSARQQLSMNFTCIPREPKESIGLLCNVCMRGSNRECTRVIEYNKFDEVAALLTECGGDCAAANSLYSPFPGSINTLVLDFNDYMTVLEESHGTVPEFINLKFLDDSKTKFKPSRIETLMQDIALLFNSGKYSVGGTIFTRFTYQPVKNALQEGIKRTLKGQAAYCATTGERDFYEVMRLRLQAAGLKLPRRSNDAYDVIVDGVVKARLFPIIVADAVAMGASLEEITQRLLPHPEDVRVSERSVLLIQGRVCIESLELDGALRLVGPMDEYAPPLVVREMTVKNSGWVVRPISDYEKTDEILSIRGFVFEEREMQTVHYAKL